MVVLVVMSGGWLPPPNAPTHKMRLTPPASLAPQALKKVEKASKRAEMAQGSRDRVAKAPVFDNPMARGDLETLEVTRERSTNKNKKLHELKGQLSSDDV